MSKPSSLVAALLLGLVGVPARPAGQVPLELEVRTRNDRGRVYCAVWPGPDGYPTERAKAAYETRSAPLAGRETRLALRVESGRAYAVACFHDENENLTLDRGFMGIPTEGTAASNDAKGFMGPPKFADARVVVTSTTTLRLSMTYL